MNNPFIYLVFLMMFGRNGLWGNNANSVQNAEIQGQLNAIRNQMSDNQNSGLLMDAVKGNNNARLELSQVRQNQYLISQLKTTTTTTA